MRLGCVVCCVSRPVLSEPLTEGFTVSWILPTSAVNDATITGMFLRVVDPADGTTVAEVGSPTVLRWWYRYRGATVALPWCYRGATVALVPQLCLHNLNPPLSPSPCGRSL